MHRNIVFTDRINIEDMNVVQNTLKIFQVSGELLPETNNPYEKWKLTTSLIPCSCSSCQIHPSCGACIYQLERGFHNSSKERREAGRDKQGGKPQY